MHRLDDVEAKFADLKILSMTDTAVYNLDTIGLRALDTRGRLFVKVVPNVQYACWVGPNYVSGVEVCNFTTLYNDHVFPAIQAPLGP